MPMVRGARFREDIDKIKIIDSPFKEEIIMINEELKALNLERDAFDKQFFGGLKGLINKGRNIILKKSDLNSKYGIDNFLNQLKKNKDLYSYFQNINFKEDHDKIMLESINEFYDILEESLSSATKLVEEIAKYQKLNFQINKLYENRETSTFLPEPLEDLIAYIKNPEIVKIGTKMCEEYRQKNAEDELNSEREQDTVSELDEIEQLRQYKNFLEGFRSSEVNDISSEVKNRNKK